MTIEKELRDRLNEFPLPETNTAWGKRRAEIRKEMGAPNWSNFREWPVVRSSLFTGRVPNTDAELDYIEGTGMHDVLDSLGFIPWNGTAIHQAHALEWGNMHSYACTILEFGGGYGEMYRVLYEWGYIGEFYVYDFPELLILQEYYLRTSGIPMDKWHPCYTKQQCLDIPYVDMVVSICALSEAPIVDRVFLHDVDPDRMLLRIQGAWDGNNNKEWVEAYAKEHDMQVATDFAPNYTNHLMVGMIRDA